MKKVIKRIIVNIFLKYKINKYGARIFLNPLKTRLFASSKSCIGDDVFIGAGFYSVGSIKIGSRVMLGPQVMMLCGNHLFAIKGKSPYFIKRIDSEVTSHGIIIEDDVWIGARVIILDSVTVGIGSVVAAGSVVNKNIPPFVLAAGSPCLLKRKIFDDNTLFAHLIDLGYSESKSAEIIARRSEELQSVELAVIDNSSKYTNYSYIK